MGMFFSLLLVRGLCGYRSVEKGVTHILIDRNRCQEALVIHVAVVEARDAERRHDSLHRTVAVVNLVFGIALLVRGIAPSVCLLDWQVSAGVQVQGHAFV